MKKILYLVLVAIFFASCSSKQPKFELEVNIQNNASLLNKKFVVTQIVDGSTIFSDTFKIKKDRFVLDIPFQCPAMMNISIVQSNVNNVLMAAEKGRIVLNIDGTNTNFGGSPLNDRLQAFNNAKDSVFELFRQIDKEYEIIFGDPKSTPQMKEELRERRMMLLTQNTDRIIAFIKENIDNPVGEYFFRNNYIIYGSQRKTELAKFATEKLKKEFGIK